MLFPTITCVDNFFDDPDAIVKKSKEFKYKVNKYSAGSRSMPLHELDYQFFNWVNGKIAAIFYPNFSDKLSFSAATHFDKVKKSDHDNWVHSDADTKFASIIFLNKEYALGNYENIATRPNFTDITKSSPEELANAQGGYDKPVYEKAFDSVVSFAEKNPIALATLGMTALGGNSSASPQQITQSAGRVAQQAYNPTQGNILKVRRA